jgi:hypothetical protein
MDSPVYPEYVSKLASDLCPVTVMMCLLAKFPTLSSIFTDVALRE